MYEKHYSSDALSLLVQQHPTSLTLTLSLSEFQTQDIIINNDVYQQIRLPDESFLIDQGAPELPTICRSVIIPDDASLHVSISSQQYTEYTDIDVAPSQGTILRTTNPDDVPYKFNDVYNNDQWYPEQLVTLQDPYILRDYRGQTIVITPFQYNPVRHILRCYTDLTLQLAFTNHNSVNTLTRPDAPTLVSSDFDAVYSRQFINYRLLSYTPLSEEGSMLIITNSTFYPQMLPFMEWKAQRGITTDIINVSDIGNATEIKEYLKQYYQVFGMTYVLLVGDVQQVPTLKTSENLASDPSYSYLAGTDHYPDVFVGRFSAQTPAQLQTQIDRTIEYEKNPDPEAVWYTKGTGIGSDQGPGDDNELDFEHIRNISLDLLNYTYQSIDEFYDGSQGGGDAPGNPTQSMIADALNDGRSIINYCGHGSSMSWGTSGFSVQNVNELVNDNRLPFIISVACYNGDFTQGTCFGEAWLRAQHNNEPIGGVAAFMSSKSQSWDPPMDAQDEMIDILTESYEQNRKTTFGGLTFNGCMHMNDRYGSQGYMETDAWHIFGDPSLQVRTKQPEQIDDVIYEPSVAFDAQSFDVHVAGMQGVLCVISRGASAFGSAVTDENGDATILFNPPMRYGQTVTFTVSGYNIIPFSDTIDVTGTDTAPQQPEKPTGKRLGSIGRNYTYETSTTDPEGHQILYQWEFNDGTLSPWVGPYNSGEVCTVEHAWGERGAHTVRVRAKDVYSLESDWSEPLDIWMPVDYNILVQLLHFMEQYFPRLSAFLGSILDA